MSSEFDQFLDDLPDLNLPESKKLKCAAAYFINLRGISEDTYKDLVQLDAWLDTPEKLSQWRAIIDTVLQRVQKYEKGKHKEPAKHPWPFAREPQELNLQTDGDCEALCVIISLWHDQYTSGYPVLTAQQKETIRKWPYRLCSCDAGILPQRFVHLHRYMKAKGLVSDLAKVAPSNLDVGVIKGKRKTRVEKIAAISAYLEDKPYAKSSDVKKGTGINASDVRHLWRPIKKALREPRRSKPSGFKKNGKIESIIDESASCRICRAPIREPFECNLCHDIIKGECKMCHFTNEHPEQSEP